MLSFYAAILIQPSASNYTAFHQWLLLPESLRAGFSKHQMPSPLIQLTHFPLWKVLLLCWYNCCRHSCTSIEQADFAYQIVRATLGKVVLSRVIECCVRVCMNMCTGQAIWWKCHSTPGGIQPLLLVSPVPFLQNGWQRPAAQVCRALFLFIFLSFTGNKIGKVRLNACERLHGVLTACLCVADKL